MFLKICLHIGIEKEANRIKQILSEIKTETNYLSKYFSDLSNFKRSSSNFELRKKINLLTFITLAFVIVSGIESAIEIIKFFFKLRANIN